MDIEILEMRAKLLGSLLTFTEAFYKIRTGREFFISQPVSNEPHVITICRALTKMFRLETKHLMINCPPGWGKSELCRHFIAWAMAHYPDSQFIYISYSYDRAEENTAYIKQIIELPAYRKMFGVEISESQSSKGHFKTTKGGTVRAFGSSGGITGQDAGLPGLDRFSGCVLIDDIHKPDEVHSDTIREAVIKNYNETIKQRPRGINVPIGMIGQRLHEDDLPARLLSGMDGYNWDRVILKALDVHNNALYPEKDPLEKMLIEKQFNPYVFSAQYMQDPQPSGGGIFKPEHFHLTENYPSIFSTFITCDTAETDKNYNDSTVFSFWGIYRTKETNEYALHWIDCREVRVEPSQLESEFMDFYTECSRFHVKPTLAAIEKKSTGITLCSVLSRIQGLHILDIERTRASGNKTTRYLEAQTYLAKHLISINENAHHKVMCLTHMGKITANNTHAHDDICDTFYDAVKICLINKYPLLFRSEEENPQEKIVVNLAYRSKALMQKRRNAYASCR